MNSRRLAANWPFPRYRTYEAMMRATAAAWFDQRGLSRDPQYPFVLQQRKQWPENVILDEVTRYIQSCKAVCEAERRPFPLHQYLHHGLSSQAMAFNLVGPLIVRQDYKPLVDALAAIGVDCGKQLHDAIFEFESRDIFNEDTAQPTSIDIALRDSEGRPFVFIEAKMMEKEFGGCTVLKSGDCSGANPLPHKVSCYLHHIGRRYWILAEKYGIAERARNEGICILSIYYQFFRELLIALEHDGIFVLFYDERSPVFHCRANGIERGLMPTLIKYVPEEYRSRVASLSMQRLVRHIACSEKHQDWIPEFRTKYGINEATSA